MSNPDTRTKREKAVTAHGEVEYETVDCCNCDSSMMIEDAISVGVGRIEYTCRGVNICSATHEKPDETRVLCEYCAESVLGYTGDATGVVGTVKNKIEGNLFELGFGVVVGLMFSLMFLSVLQVVMP